MHIEPGIVAGPKMALAHGTAAAAAAYTARLAIDDLRTHGLASFAQRTVIAAIGVFISFEVMPHFGGSRCSNCGMVMPSPEHDWEPQSCTPPATLGLRQGS